MGNKSYTILTKKIHVFALAGVIIFLLILGGYFFYLHEANIERDDAFNELKAVAQLKIDQISSWNKERLLDVKALANDHHFVKSVENYLHKRNASNKQIIVDQLSLVAVKNIYENELLFSANGDLLFSQNPLTGLVDTITPRLVKEAINNRGIFSSDLYYYSAENEILDDFIAPIINLKKQTIAVIILRIRPKDYLYPLLNFWPLPGNSPENIIVERNGSKVRFLSELKQIKNAIVNFNLPLTDKISPAAQAALGYRGFLEGKDYYGINILAYVSPVPGTNWSLISSEHTSEAYSRLHSKVGAIILFTVLMILLFATGIIWIYHYRQKNIYRELFIKEKELREYHEEFRTILYSIGDGVLTTDTSGNIKQMNSVAEELTGFNEKVALGKPLDDIFNIISERTRNKVENPVHKVLRDGVITGLANHTILISKDGKEIPIADSAAPIRNEQGEIEGVVLVFRDKTVEYHQEKVLRESEARLNESQRVAALGHYIFDIKKGNWTNSENLDAVFGINSSYNKNIEGWLNIIDTSQRNEMLFFLTENILKQKQIFDKEYKIIRQNDGETRWVHGLGNLEFDLQGNPIKMFGVIQDITEIKLLNEELKESEELFRTTLYGIGDGIISSDNHGNIIQMNPVAEALTGWKLADAKGLPVGKVFNIINAETRSPVANPTGRVLETGSVVGLANHTALISKDGKEYQIADSAAPIRNHEGKIIGAIMVFSDITEQYAAREALRKSEEKFRKAFMTSPDAININRLEDGMYISINKVFTQIMGYTEDEVIGKTSVDLNIWVKAEDRQEFLDRLKKNGVLENYETHFRSKSGEIKDGLLSASLLEVEGVPHIINITIDITVRKKLEKILAESEERFRSIFHENKAVMILIDIENDSKIVDANEAACKYYGYTKEYLLQNIHAYHLSIDSVDKIKQRMGEYLSGEQNYLTSKHILSNGKVRDVDIYISVISTLGKKYVFSIINDITDEKMIQVQLDEYKKHLESLVKERTAELEASTERFRHLSENSKDSIFRIDSKFVMHYMNKSMKERWEIKEEENLLDVLAQNKVPKSLINSISSALEKTFETKTIVREQIFHVNKFWMDWVFIPEISAFNEVKSILGFGRDITEIKLLQEKIQSAFEKEKELNQLKTNFISFASHEFRTPLTKIQTSAELLRLFGRKWDEGKYNNHFNQIETSIDEITHMLDQVLTISRVERGKYAFEPAKANIRFLIDEVIAGINLLPYFNHIISVNYAIERAEFNIDTKLVKSILQNLISNAVKYSAAATRIEVYVIQEENSLRFELLDHGIGIPESEIEKIFEPFHRASNIGAVEGTGLGLAIVKLMVELHRGTISVQSKINEGTKFMVIIKT